MDKPSVFIGSSTEGLKIAKTVQLLPPLFNVNWDEVESLVTSRTKLIMINTPHNPCGVVLEQTDLKRLEEIVVKHGLFVISDEVYEHIIFDGHQHQSVLRYPELYKRSFVVFSFVNPRRRHRRHGALPRPGLPRTAAGHRLRARAV